MISFLFVLLSGFTGALYALSYKLRERRGYPIYLTLFLFSFFSSVFSLVFITVFHEPVYSFRAFILGIPYGLAMIVSLSLYFVVTETTKLNITWTIIQFSVLIPFAFSVIWYKETVVPLAQAGIGCVLLSLVLFAFSKSRGFHKPTIPYLRTASLLFLSSFFTGFSMCFPKIYSDLDPTAGPFTLLLYRGMAMLPGAFLLFLYKEGSFPCRRRIIGIMVLTASMSLNGILLGAFIILALRNIPGSIAFPLRTIVNVLCVFILSYFLFREKVRLMEGLGVGVALTGISLVTATIG